MSNKIIIIILTIGFASFSCKTLNYAKEEEKKKVKLPFEQKDYPNTDKELFSIQNTKGETLSILRTRILLQAKADFSQLIKSKIQNIATLEQSSTLSQESEIFNLKVDEIANSSMALIKLIDSEVLRQKKEDGDEYEMWSVFKIDVDAVIELINNSNIGFTVDNDDFKRKALIN